MDREERIKYFKTLDLGLEFLQPKNPFRIYSKYEKSKVCVFSILTDEDIDFIKTITLEEWGGENTSNENTSIK